MSGQEIERVYSGNPAFYKWKYDKQGNLVDRTVDELKRLGGLSSTGDNNYMELKDIPVKYIKDGEFTGKYVCAEVDNEMIESPTIQVRKKNNKQKNKNDEEKLKDDDDINIVEDIFTFNYSQYFKFLQKGNNKIKKILRNFKYPPSIHEESKKSQLKYKFEEECCDSNFPFHYGMFYSNSAYIYYFLMRQQPYDNLLIKTQSYKLEDPDRTFRNLIALNNLTNEINDNRELIPELFSKIEMFLNLNCDLYGVLQINNKIVDDYEIDSEIKKEFFSTFDFENYPLIQIISDENYEDILKVSKEMRNNIRGEDIGGLG